MRAKRVDKPIAIRLGIRADSGTPPLIRLDHVRLPKEKTTGPKYMTLYIAELTESLPGYGLLLLVKSACFCTQNISISPPMPKMQIMGWREA